MSCQPSERLAILNTAKPITDLLERYQDGLKQHERSVIRKLLLQYLEVEKVPQSLCRCCPGTPALMLSRGLFCLNSLALWR